ncbi:MAG: hypothetical protein OMM_15416, partial [Candidatus Magnetoglobus multicellularis str. Araruama]
EDVDANDILTYTATLTNGNVLPAWLTFTPISRNFGGTPLNSDVGVVSIRVTAEDQSVESVSDDFSLTVINVNDAPTIEGDTFSLPENSNNGTAVGSISVNDQDEGDVPTVTIINGDPNNAFSIDDNGDITVNDKTYLDYETETSFTLTVQAADSEFSPTDTVIINIT